MDLGVNSSFIFTNNKKLVPLVPCSMTQIAYLLPIPIQIYPLYPLQCSVKVWTSINIPIMLLPMLPRWPPKRMESYGRCSYVNQGHKHHSIQRSPQSKGGGLYIILYIPIILIRKLVITCITYTSCLMLKRVNECCAFLLYWLAYITRLEPVCPVIFFGHVFRF